MNEVVLSSDTDTFTAPTGFAGVTQVISVVDTTTTDVAATPPKVTVPPDVQVVPVPKIVTAVPPEVGPKFGDMVSAAVV